MNDKERGQWVDNDEWLYRWMQSSRQGKTVFVRAHRKEIDAYVDRAMNGEKPVYTSERRMP